MYPVKRIIAGRPVLGYVYDNFAPSAIYDQVFRWIRKPTWAPTAKSKVFRITGRVPYPKDVEVEIIKLNNHYRTFMTSLRTYCLQQNLKMIKVTDTEALAKLENEDFEYCIKINDEWNKKQAEAREKRRAIEKEQMIIKSIQHMEKEDKKLQLEREVIDAKIRMAKKESVTFITEKNIDEAIENALNNVVSYDKVLDIHGNYYEVTVGGIQQQEKKDNNTL